MKIRLGPPRFGEDNRLAGRPQAVGLGKRPPERHQERLPLGVLRDRHGEGPEAFQIGNFLLDRSPVLGRKPFNGLLLVFPLFGRFVERFVVLLEGLFDRLLRFAPGDHGFNRPTIVSNARDGKR